MWARIVEFMLACWLAISPYIFGYTKEETLLWINDYVCSSLLIFFSLICLYKPLRKMHLCNLILAFWLISMGFYSKSLPLPGYIQNYVVLGILLLMIGIVPSEASLPPMPWRKFYESR